MSLPSLRVNFVVDHFTTDINSYSPANAMEPFAGWMDEQLTELEDNFREFWTQRSVISALLAKTYSFR